MPLKRPIVVSFSGIDGAGKSTQIEALCSFLNERGFRWRLYRFWDDVVTFSRFREKCSLRVFKGDKGIGSPDRPIRRRDKNVTSWPVVLFRLVLYLADALSLRVRTKRFGRNTEFVIFDRYIYDELANLPLKHWAMKRYIEFVAHLAPKPDAALVLDADPLTAHKRKPEYPVEFVHQNRGAYLFLTRSFGMTLIPPSSVEETATLIRQALFNSEPVMKELARSANRELPRQAAASQSGKSPFFSTTSSR